MRDFNPKNNYDYSSDLKEIIEDGNVKKLNEFCYKYGEKFAKEGLSTSQIRKIFDTILTMNEYDENYLHLLRPKIAYTVGRHKKKIPIIQEFGKLIEDAIKMTNEKNFKNFKNFVEALVAYHKFHGGKE
jgi:CRISPR-associated protein Csm2